MFSLKKEEVNVGRQRELDLVKGFLMIMILCMAELVRNRIRDRKDTR